MKSKSGVKFDSEKRRLDLLAPDFLNGVGDVLTFGAAKYEAWNWAKGMAWSRVYGATLRHLMAWALGEDFDPESGISHLYHAACNLMFLSTYARRGLGTDDRQKYEGK